MISGAWALALLLGVAVLLFGFLLIVLYWPRLGHRWDVVAVGNSAWNDGAWRTVAYTTTRWGARRIARRLNAGPEGTGIERHEVERAAA